MKLRINEQGLAEGVRYAPSPNCDERPAGCAVELIVIHSISLPPGEFGGPEIEALFMNRLDPGAHPYFAALGELRASAHFLVRRDGQLVQFVPCTKRAWHAGASSFKGRPRCNDYSIGIELEGTDSTAFARDQYETLAALTRALNARYPIRYMAGHSDVAPGRKTDPGPFFDWERYLTLLHTKRRDPKPAAGMVKKAKGARRAASPRGMYKRPSKSKAARCSVKKVDR